MGIVQDTLLGSQKMTKRDVFIERDLMMNMVMWVSGRDYKGAPRAARATLVVLESRGFRGAVCVGAMGRPARVSVLSRTCPLQMKHWSGYVPPPAIMLPTKGQPGMSAAVGAVLLWPVICRADRQALSRRLPCAPPSPPPPLG
jgi:hypothetical protein